MVLRALWNVFEPAPHWQINTQLLHSWTVRASKFLWIQGKSASSRQKNIYILGIMHFKVTSWHNQLTNLCSIVAWSYHSQKRPKWPWSMAQYLWPRPGHRVTGTPETIHHAGTTQQPTKGRNTGHHTGASSTSPRHPMPWQFYFRIPWLHPRLSHDCCKFNVAMNLVKDGLRMSEEGFYWPWCEYLFKMSTVVIWSLSPIPAFTFGFLEVCPHIHCCL